MDTYKEHRTLVKFMTELNTQLKNKYSPDFKIGQNYKGDKEISFFTLTPTSLQKQKLKIAIVYNYQGNQFEIWLAGQNREIQKKYWSIFKDSYWDKYHIPENVNAGFSIVDHVLVAKPNFRDSEKLKFKIESEAMKFIDDILEVLAE